VTTGLWIPETIKRARLRLLDQMTEELVIDRRAEELGINAG
jgi:hypothetical protein